MTNDFPPQPPQYPASAAAAPLNPSDERLWMTLIDVGGIFFGFIPALIGYLVLKDRSPFVGRNSAGAFNFQITILIAYVVGWILTFILIGFLIVLAAAIVNLIFSIIAALQANKGLDYRYPLQIPVFK
jgi:uncharacterized protein